MTRPPDPVYAHPRLAAVYDAFEPVRPDLPPYEALVRELGARSVLDVGCGTGVLARRLAETGLEVTGLDPAVASLDVARSRPGADRVRWVEGTAERLDGCGVADVDLVLMTGNAAQAILDDDAWRAFLAGARAVLGDGGHLVFETRRPDARGWQAWLEPPDVELVADDGEVVRSRLRLTEVALPLVSFRRTYTFAGGVEVPSETTLRFRGQAEVEADLAAAGFEVREVRDAPDRPGLELVFVARRPR